MAGLLGGISEPSLYGVLLRFKKTYLRLLPGCFLGGVVMGFFDVRAYAFVFTSLLTIPAMDPIFGYAIGLAVAFFTSMLLVVFLDYRGKEEKEEALARIAAEREEASRAEDERIDAADTAVATGSPERVVAAGDTFQIGSPLAGRVVPLNEVPDEAFAAGAVGKGLAVDPSGDTVVAPADGSVMVAFPTGHAVGLKLDSGVQLLVHIGIDTVNMEGKGFELLVAKGDRVTAGQPLVRFDRAAIEEAGYSAITPVVVTNHRKLADVVALTATGEVAVGDPVIDATAKVTETV